jgi:choline dehydrogenase
MLSGIGDPEQLMSHGIDVVRGSPGVGRNLQDHACATVKMLVNVRTSNMDITGLGRLRSGLRFGLFGSGPASHVFGAVAFAKILPGSEYPDVQYHFGAFAREVGPQGSRLLARPAVTLMANVNRSRSRGTVGLRSPDPADPPVIQPNMLGDRYDLETLIAGVKLARSVFATAAFRPYVIGEYTPGKTVESDAKLERFVRNTASSGFHVCGTARMGSDADAVVDPRLRVNGVQRLRVIDCSVIPQVPSGNINAITMVIGEKGADMMLEDAGRFGGLG